MCKGRIISLSKEEFDNIFQKFGVDKQEGDHTMESETGVKLIDVDRLKPHPRNVKIYGEETVLDLVAQIEAYGGIADPLKIKEDYTIISGHRRWQAARELGMTEVPCQFVSYDSEEEELAALVMLNYHRAKTNEQKAREGMALEEALRAEGMERKLKALKQYQTDRDPGSPSVDAEDMEGPSDDADTEDKQGRTRDIVADAVNISSGRNFDRMKKVIVAVDKLKENGKTEDADFLLQMLGRSVKPVYNLVDAGFPDDSDEERERIRSGEVSVNQYIAKKADKPEQKRKMSFQQVAKLLSTAKQVLSDVDQACDTLKAAEVDELIRTLDAIQSELKSVNSRLRKQQRKNQPLGDQEG